MGTQYPDGRSRSTRDKSPVRESRSPGSARGRGVILVPTATLDCATHMCSQPKQYAHELHMVVLAKGWGLPSARLGSLRIHLLVSPVRFEPG
jgi:hypothetical protein